MDIIDHIEDVPTRRPAPTNTPILNRTLILAIAVKIKDQPTLPDTVVMSDNI
jgi:hypothetical protein